MTLPEADRRLTLALTWACSLEALSSTGVRYRCSSWWSFSSLFATPRIFNSTLSSNCNSRSLVDEAAMMGG